MSRTKPKARRRLTAAITALLCFVVSSALAAERSSDACRNVVTDGAWSSIRAPVEVRAFAAAPGASNRLFVTDGKTVFASADGGCAWSIALTLPALPNEEIPFAGEQITAMTAPTATTVYAAATGPHVVVSRDGGRTWTTEDSGLTPRGDPVEVIASTVDPSTLYLSVDTSVGDDSLDNGFTPATGSKLQASSLFRSEDAGASWERARLPSVNARGPRGTGVERGTSPGSTWDLSISPSSARRLWAATSDGIYGSEDAGETWTGVVTDDDAPGIDVRAIDAVESATAGVVAIDPSSGTVYSSGPADWSPRVFDGFKTIYSVYETYSYVWLAHSGDGTILGSGPKGAFRQNERGWADVSPASLGTGAGTLAGLLPDPSEESGLYGRMLNGGTTLFHYVPTRTDARAEGDRQGLPTIGALTSPSQSIGELAAIDPARLAPPTDTIRLRAGETASRTYVLNLPPKPTPLDVYFLLDSTSSMSNAIRTLARSAAQIVSKLRADGVDVWAGLGEFRTYPRPGDGGYNFPYRRDVDISPPGPELGRALMNIEGNGSSGANLTGLLQAATGAGQDVVPPGSSAGDIPRDSGAHWRDGSLRVIVHAADTPFATPDRGDAERRFPPPTWPGPGFEETIAALRAGGIKQVGAAIGYSNDDGDARFGNAPQDLERVAEGTATLAPPGGIDCDGDHHPDVAARRPLVCPVPSGDAGALVSGIVSLLEGIEDVAPVRVIESSRSGVVAGIAPTSYPAVDLHAHHSLDFEVVFSCESGQVGTTSDVDLAAEVAEVRVARAEVRVVCEKKPVPLIAPPPPRNAQSRVAAAAVPPPVPPPPPPPIANPGPAQAPAPQAQPQTNPNPNPQGQAQAVAVAQRQEQPQMAFVHAAQEVREQLQMEYAMSSSHSRPDPLSTAKLSLGAGALSVVLLYGYATVTVRALRRARATG